MSKKVYGSEYFTNYKKYLIEHYGYTENFAELINECAMNLSAFYGIEEHLESICKILSTVKFILVSNQELNDISFNNNEVFIPIGNEYLNDNNKVKEALLKGCIKCLHSKSCGMSYEEYLPDLDRFVHAKIMNELVLDNPSVQVNPDLDDLFKSEEDGEILRNFLITGDTTLLENFALKKQPKAM